MALVCNNLKNSKKNERRYGGGDGDPLAGHFTGLDPTRKYTEKRFLPSKCLTKNESRWYYSSTVAVFPLKI